MFRLFDRYILKEIVPPFLLGLLVYTFVLLMNQILLLSEMFVARRVPLGSVLELLVYLIPSILAFTVPMAVLMGILAGLTRMSTDMEITAFKTLGVSNSRFLQPVLFFCFIGWIVTSVLCLYLAPRANYRWVQSFSRSVLSAVQFNIKPREFNESITDLVLFVQDMTQEGDWKNPFVYFTNPENESRIIFANRGRLNFFPHEKRATLKLFTGASHSYPYGNPEKYRVTTFQDFEEEISLEKLYSQISAKKRVREKDIGELFKAIQSLRQETREGSETDKVPFLLRSKEREEISHLIEIHKKFALPFACFIFAFLGVSLGASTRKGGRAGGFTISVVIIIIYYILMTGGENIAMDGRIAPWLGMWGANILLCLASIIIFLQSHREWPSLSQFLERFREKGSPASQNKKRRLRLSLPRFSLRFPNILDRYIMRKFLALYSLVFISLLAVFAIITFFERIDNVYEHQKPLALFFEYLWYKIPEFIHYILPVAALAATLLSLGLLTKFNEITAMKACGISLYRIVLPVVTMAGVICLFSFYLDENVLPYYNKKAEETWSRINDLPPRTYNRMDRRWVMGKNKNRIYYYQYFDPITSAFSQLSIFDIDSQSWSLKRRIYSEKGFLHEEGVSLVNCWFREFDGDQTVKFEQKDKWSLTLSEDRGYFLRDRKEPDQMSYQELKQYIHEIEERGFETVRFKFDLYNKISFSLATLVMVLLAIPFSFSMGKRGALVGLGLSIIIAMVYWGALGIFRGLGYGSYLAPFLAAWGPNLVFGLAGLYLLFALRM